MVPIFMSQLLRPKTKKEGYHELQKRIKLFLADLECELEEDDEILIISHFLIQKMFIYEITGKTEELDNGAIRELEIKKEKLF